MSERVEYAAGRALQAILFLLVSPFLIGMAAITLFVAGCYIYLIWRIGLETLTAMWRLIS